MLPGPLHCTQGGAITAAGDGDLIVTGGIFRRNVAAEGSALSAVSSRSLKVSNTSFDDPANAFAGEAAEVQVRALVCLLHFASCAA